MWRGCEAELSRTPCGLIPPPSGVNTGSQSDKAFICGALDGKLSLHARGKAFFWVSFRLLENLNCGAEFNKSRLPSMKQAVKVGQTLSQLVCIQYIKHSTETTKAYNGGVIFNLAARF
jgi:hypothetical protein